MATAVKLGPADHGMPISEEEARSADFERGYQYEIIDGRLYVTYLPDMPEGMIELWLLGKMRDYSRRRPKIVNLVSNKSRVFVPNRPELTVPEPDLAAYQDFPLGQELKDLGWQDFSPLLVAEILSRNDPHKDLVRNAKLYLLVPSIKEYWILDGREDADRPSMRVHRRQGKKWRIADLAFGDTYTTRLLPGFKLVIDPHR